MYAGHLLSSSPLPKPKPSRFAHSPERAIFAQWTSNAAKQESRHKELGRPRGARFCQVLPPLSPRGQTISMKLQFKEQQFQLDAVVSCFAGQPLRAGRFTLERGDVGALLGKMVGGV